MSGATGRTVHLCCGIPYRRRDNLIEFCLLLAADDRAWEFPQLEAVNPADGPALLIAHLARGGHEARLAHAEPLGQHKSSREQVTKHLDVYLLEVVQSTPVDEAKTRSRWCLSHEAKGRLRRKPLRFLVDAAERHLQTPG